MSLRGLKVNGLLITFSSIVDNAAYPILAVYGARFSAGI
jgi:hypothetical protein